MTYLTEEQAQQIEDALSRIADKRNIHFAGDAQVVAGEALATIRAARSQEPEPAHPDDEAVDRFATAMKAKLAKKRSEGRGGWEDKNRCSAEFLNRLLNEHVGKGDPVDVGNLAMMLWNRDERTEAARAQEQAEQEPKPPKWYTREEIIDVLKRMNYCEPIAQELADWLVLHLQHSFNKGFRVGQWKMYSPIEPVKREPILLKFPRELKPENSMGWTVDYGLIRDIAEAIGDQEFHPGYEGIELTLIALESVYAGPVCVKEDVSDLEKNK